MTEEATTLPVDVAQPDDAQFAITDLAPTARALVALKSTQTEQDLMAMAAKHTGLVEIKDKAGREQVHGAAMELMRARTTVKRLADEVRDDAKKFNAAVIAEEKRLTAIVEPEELRLKALRDGYDAEQERIKREAEEKERARVLALGARIQEIRSFARLAQDCRSSDAVRRLIERLGSIDMTGFAELEVEAINVLTETRQQVEQVLNARMATEAEAARIRAGREELARQQAEAKQKADELAAQQKAEADKLAADRAEFARQQQEAADKLAEQQAEVARMRAEIEAAKAPAPAPFQVDGQIVAGKALREAVEAAGATLADVIVVEPTCCEKGPAGGVCSECADTSAAYQADMRPVRDADLVDTADMGALVDAEILQDARAEASEVRLGFDMAMSMAIATTSPAFIGIDHGTDAPPAASLIKCIAFEYGVDQETACQWLVARGGDFESWVPAVADIA